MSTKSRLRQKNGFLIIKKKTCKITQECEMDLLIRFWDEIDNNVKLRYLGSSFFGHATVKDLSKQFKEITQSLVPPKIFQVSMDDERKFKIL